MGDSLNPEYGKVRTILYQIPLAPMGVLAPGSAHARPSTRPPINTSGNFPADVSAESHSNISPNPSEVKSEVIHVCGSNKNLKKPKNRPPGGQGVGIRI